jgi:hypothetical protein
MAYELSCMSWLYEWKLKIEFKLPNLEKLMSDGQQVLQNMSDSEHVSVECWELGRLGASSPVKASILHSEWLGIPSRL